MIDLQNASGVSALIVGYEWWGLVGRVRTRYVSCGEFGGVICVSMAFSEE